MDITTKSAEIEIQNHLKNKELYSLEEVFEHIDTKFIDFYGEYGRKIVNTRRNEWNQDGIVNLKTL